MSNKNANLTHSEQVLQFVEITGAVIEKTAAMRAEQKAQAEKIAKLVPQAAQALLENDRIEPHEKEAALKVLQDPIKVLEILIKTAAHRNNEERASLGKPEGKVKQANYNSLSDNYAGRRSRPEESESDKAFRRGLGL